MYDPDDKLLDGLVDMVANGRDFSEPHMRRLRGMLEHHQAKIDLVKVGITHHQIQRLKRLSGLAEDVETSLFGEEGEKLLELEASDRIALLKTVNKEFRDTSNFIESQSTKPTISSPETMSEVSKVDEQVAGEDVKTHALPPDARDKVRLMVEKIKSRIQIVDVEAETSS